MIEKIAFVFPGQGSQSVGMLRELSEVHPVVRATFAEASDALGLDLWSLVSEGPRDVLDRTENTQPAMLAAGVSVWRAWNAAGGPAPSWMAGHSLGEFTALVSAGAIGFGDAIRLVADRGRFMQDAVPAGAGAMAAVLGLSEGETLAVCAAAAEGQVLEAVNFNAPGQVVIAGDAQAVRRGITAAKAAGAKRALSLPVSVPSHCELMRPAAERLAQALEGLEILSPAVPVLHNVSAGPASDPDEIRGLLTRQLYSPVRWVETVRELVGQGATVLVEAGPGKVLAGLAKRIDKKLTALAVSDSKSLAAALEDLRDA